MSPAAQFAWQVLPIANLVQFPWRLLGLTAVTMSVVAGALLGRGVGDQVNGSTGQRVNEAARQVINGETVSPSSLDPSPVDLLLVALVIALGSFAYTLPQYTPVEPWRERPEAVVRWDRFSPADRVAMVIYTEEQPTTGPMEAQYLAGDPLQVATILTGMGTVETLRHGGASDEVRVLADVPVTVQFYTYDFPGWRVAIDGRPVAHRHEPPYGLITLDVPAGEHRVSLRMGSTPPRIVGSAISLVAALAIGVGLVGGHIWRRPSHLL